jgi:allantoinase
MSPNRLRVFVSDNVLLPGANDPSPATIEVDLSDSGGGKIKRIHARRRTRGEYADLEDDNDWIDVGERWILPGLVE